MATESVQKLENVDIDIRDSHKTLKLPQSEVSQSQTSKYSNKKPKSPLK